METAKVDLRKLQLLNDRITQVIEALNQVRFSVNGLQHTPAVAPQMNGPWAWGQVAPWAQPWPQQWAQPQWSAGPQQWAQPQWSAGPQQWNPGTPGPSPVPGPVGGLSHTAADESWNNNAWPQQRWPQQQAWSWPNQWAWGQQQQWAQPAPWAQPTPWANPGI